MDNESLEKHELGVVKWFGGFDSKNDRVIDFGYIESLEGESIFVHKSSFIQGLGADGVKVSFVRATSERGPTAVDVRLVSLSEDILLNVFQVLKKAQGSSGSVAHQKYMHDAVATLLAIEFAKRKLIIKEIFEDEWGFKLLEGQRHLKALYDDLIEVYGLEKLVESKVSLEDLSEEHFLENEEEFCRLICSGKLTSVPSRILKRSSTPILYACALVRLVGMQPVIARKDELEAYLQEKLKKPDSVSALLYKDIFDECITRIGGYRASPIVWDIFSELLLKKFIFDRDFHKAESLYQSNAGLSRKIDCFILFNLSQLLAAGNDLHTTYNIFVHLLWQLLASRKVGVEVQISRILSLFPSCGTAKLETSSASKEAELSCEAVYWEQQNKYLCRGRLCLGPQVRPDAKRHYLEYTIYDWLVHFGVEFWGSDDHLVRDFPIKLAGYFNRLREIMSRLHCRTCSNIMVPDFKYSRVKCSVYENGRWVEKDMAAAYRNTVFYCNQACCSEYESKHYINHCLESLCYDLIDSRELKVKCDGGLLVCKGCGSCCPQHGKTNPVGFCSECGAHLQLYEDPSQVSRFGRKSRFVRCSNRGCSFEFNEPRMPKKFYSITCQPVHTVRGKP